MRQAEVSRSRGSHAMVHPPAHQTRTAVVGAQCLSQSSSALLVPLGNGPIHCDAVNSSSPPWSLDNVHL
eukprot:4559839-Amphidinium_carterae.1